MAAKGRAVTSNLEKKPLAPIPAFYACYLLRSTVRHASLYVGSTPNPVRRLKQHNGEASGGAARTSRDSLRPWEMTCLVHGFPSKVAALQFEWAWQNTHLTRHVEASERITQMTTTKRTSWRTGRVYHRVARPRIGLMDRLANLHLLLGAKSFHRWPLSVTFYAEDVYKVWRKWVQSEEVGKLRSDIEVTLYSPGSAAAGVPHGIYTIDTSYKQHKSYLEKAKNLFGREQPLECAVCSESVPSDGSLTLVCPSDECRMTSHLSCLSKAFLDGCDDAAVVPIHGQCPCCGSKLQWVTLVRELSLRMRDSKTVDKILKKRIPKVSKRDHARLGAVEAVNDDEGSDDNEENGFNVENEGDGWHELFERSEAMSEIHSDSSAGEVHTGPSAAAATPAITPEVEDSDWEAAALLT